MTPGPEHQRFQRILIPTDGSPTSEHAVEVALDMAETMGATVTGLYVMDASAYATLPGDVEWGSIREILQKESEETLDTLEERCSTRDLACERDVREGHPAQEIIEASRDHDLVVMGTHGRSGIRHLLMGSVTEKVIRHAPVPVLVVRAPEDRI